MSGGVGVEHDDVANRGPRAVAMAYAQLIRVPNLFTAPPDVVLGAALIAAAGYRAPPIAVGGLAAASMALYAGGTTLNDAFDAPEDALTRPDRPIPSGRVRRRTAFVLGFGFLLLGVALAFAATGGQGAFFAGLVAAAIVIYDGVANGTAVGFIVMGATRGGNVLLGTTVAAVSLPALPRSALAVPAIVAIYIAAVTFMAARETEGDNPGAIEVVGIAALAAVLTLGWYVATVRPSTAAAGTAAVLAGAYLVWIGRPLRTAYADPAPDTVGPAVGACVLGLVLLDAAFAAGAGVVWAIVAAAFLVPAWGLSRTFDVT